jgi:hypothetical protein
MGKSPGDHVNFREIPAIFQKSGSITVRTNLLLAVVAARLEQFGLRIDPDGGRGPIWFVLMNALMRGVSGSRETLQRP